MKRIPLIPREEQLQNNNQTYGCFTCGYAQNKGMEVRNDQGNFLDEMEISDFCIKQGINPSYACPRCE